MCSSDLISKFVESKEFTTNASEQPTRMMKDGSINVTSLLMIVRAALKASAAFLPPESVTITLTNSLFCLGILEFRIGVITVTPRAWLWRP